jgi:hypothetical protein
MTSSELDVLTLLQSDLFAEALPVKTSAQLARERACTVLEAAFSLSSGAWSQNSYLRGWYSKTWRAGRVDGWTLSASLWNSSTMSRYQSRLRQLISARPTCAHAFSSSGIDVLPTPLASDSKRGIRGAAQWERHSMHLRQALFLLPTLTASGYGRNKGGSKPGRERRSLRGLLPTLTASRATYMQRRGVVYPQLGAITDGPLNPRFLEWFLGFPDGWTASVCSGTP